MNKSFNINPIYPDTYIKYDINIIKDIFSKNNFIEENKGLLNNEFDINIVDENKNNLLQDFLIEKTKDKLSLDDLNYVLLLINSNNNVNNINNQGQNVIFEAIKHQDYQLFKLLVGIVDLNVKDKNNLSPINYCIKINDCSSIFNLDSFD